MTDGLLAEFTSVVDAVGAAIEIQEATPDLSENSPEDQRIALRIGVNIGDVVAQDGDILGDGVNIAARIQELAAPKGLSFTPSGRTGVVNPVVSDRALDRIRHGGRPDIFMGGSIGPKLTGELEEQPHHNTCRWDFVMEDDDFFKGGCGGQGLYISPTRDMVVAFVGTPGADSQENQMTYIARQLSKVAF